MSKVALITGVTGQDGSYLTEFLLQKNYEVHGVIRRHSTPCTERIENLLDKENFLCIMAIYLTPATWQI